MIKKLEVDVDASLKFQANARLKPADKSEYANKNIRTYECPKCKHKAEINKLTFGEDVLCPNCNEVMIQNQ